MSSEQITFTAGPGRPSQPCLRCYISALLTPVVLLIGTVTVARWLYRRLPRK
jgi:hypothetical protein